MHTIAHLLLLKYIYKTVLGLWLCEELCSVLVVSLSVSYCDVKCPLNDNQEPTALVFQLFPS